MKRRLLETCYESYRIHFIARSGVTLEGLISAALSTGEREPSRIIEALQQTGVYGEHWLTIEEFEASEFRSAIALRQYLSDEQFAEWERYSRGVR